MICSPVDEFLPKHLLDDVFVVVISECPRKFVVVHIVFVFSEAPELRDLLGVDEFELHLHARPGDEVLVLPAAEQLQQELPQRDVAHHGISASCHAIESNYCNILQWRALCHFLQWKAQLLWVEPTTYIP